MLKSRAYLSSLILFVNSGVGPENCSHEVPNELNLYSHHFCSLVFIPGEFKVCVIPLGVFSEYKKNSQKLKLSVEVLHSSKTGSHLSTFSY